MNGVLTSVLDVFDSVGAWMIEHLDDYSSLFYSAEEGLTFLGTMCVASLSVGIVFLFIGVIQKFLRFGA